MLPKDLIKKIQRFHFRTRFLANETFAGRYVSAFKGMGMEFTEVREYLPGDDVRSIDWNVSARFGHPFVKLFHEEREMTLILMLDLSGSELFGTRKRFKRELLAEVAGLLAFLAIRTNDKVGAILFTSEVEAYLPPKKGAGHVWRLIKEIFTRETTHTGTDIAAALEFLMNVVRRRAIVFLISDCLDENFQKPLLIAGKKHTITIMKISDPSETEFPDAGLVFLEDPETGERVLVNSSSRSLRTKIEAWRKQMDLKLEQDAARAGADLVHFSTDGSVVDPLARFFQQRAGRR